MPAVRIALLLLVPGLVFTGGALGHGGHDHGVQVPMVDESADWATRHMAEEHHMTSWDPESFFALHDYNADGVWQPDELQRTYGLMDESNRDMARARRDEVVQELLRLLDSDGDGAVGRDEWLRFAAAGGTLPDLGTGPGHHGDDEYEYEIHHWEKYHNDDSALEDLTHPEDVEHFRRHEQREAEEERLAQLDQMAIVEENIPQKFRRVQ